MPGRATDTVNPSMLRSRHPALIEAKACDRALLEISAIPEQSSCETHSYKRQSTRSMAFSC